MFFVAALFAVTMASLPDLHLPGNPSDTVLHILAFFVLAVLAQLAFPIARIWVFLLGLGTLGAGIELIQIAPIINRDASLTDWLADMVAVVFAVAIFRVNRSLFASRDLIQD